jgi:hypothetical protein
MTLFGWLHKIHGKRSEGGNISRRSTTARPRLEELEDRVTPAALDTTTNVTISIAPNFVSRAATETITATVTQSGTTTPVTTGSVAFNLNGQTTDAGLSSTGTANFTVSLPLYALVGSQTLAAAYSGATTSTDTFNPSMFLSPVYLNVLNAVLPSQITFGTPPSTTFSPSFNSAGGETNTVSLFSIPIVFKYVDPGTIDTFTILGFTLPGSLSGTVFAGIEATVASVSPQLL